MEKKEIIDVLNLLDQLEIKGKSNIFIMFQLVGFFQKKLEDIIAKEKLEPPKGV